MVSHPRHPDPTERSGLGAGTIPALTDRQVTGVLQQRERLQDIAELRLTDDDMQALLHEACAAAAADIGLPMGLVSVVLDEAQYFAAQHGLTGWLADASGSPVEWSFCRYAVATRAPFVVHDAEAHPLLQENPLVQRDGLRCYAGIPLISARGFALGSFCVVGTEAFHFTDDDLRTLRRHADDVLARIESRRRPVVA
jgi:GAF domain-containing protein